MSFQRAKPLGATDDVDVITASEFDIIDVNQSRAIDGTGGGNHTPATDIEFFGTAILKLNHLELVAGGSTDIDHPVDIEGTTDVTWVGTTNLPKLGSRSYPIIQAMGQPLFNTGTRFTFNVTVGSWIQSDVTDDGPAGWILQNPPNRATLSSVTVRVAGDGGTANHAGGPGITFNVPSVEVFKRSSTGAVALIGVKTFDPSANLAAYIIAHDITVSGLSELIDGDDDYFIEFEGEDGGGSTPNALQLIHIKATFTVTEIAPG